MSTKFNLLIRSAALTFAAGLCCGLVPAGAATVDLATSPMVTGVSKVVPPNIYFILDDSLSMNEEYMPDSVNSNNSKNCYRNFGYNKIYYNPNVTYTAPIKADGTSYADQDYTAAMNNGFDTSGSPSTTNLNTAVSATFNLSNNPYTSSNGNKNVVVAHTGHGYSVGQIVSFSPSSTFRGVTVNGSYAITAVSANNYTIVTTGGNATSSGTGGGNGRVETRFSPMPYYVYTSSPTSPPSTCANDNQYTKTVPTTAAQKTNFANWYSFYRKRILMMKTAAGRAFADIDDGFRVGFSTIGEKGTGAAEFLNVKTFGATQKASWYTKLYGATPSGYTPLRGALSKAGRLYAGKLISGVNDPVQYSCQQNFTILTTDGYWNLEDEVSSSNTADNTINYGPYKINNKDLVGQQDWVSASPKNPSTPYFDGGKYINTLADIAAYYYQSDLRPGYVLGGYLDDGSTRLDVSSNNVPKAGADEADWQHMTTYTLGLGVAGTLNYADNYLTGGSSDYEAILQGTKNWPNPDVTNNSYTVTTRIDDLWHAGVNGRGRYLSASNPDEVVEALGDALAAISIKDAASAAAATSSLEPVEGDNYAYVAQYTTGLWEGDLHAHTIDVGTGALSDTEVWSASSQVDTLVSASSDSRTIYTFSSSATNKLKDFTSGNLTSEIAAKYFKSDGTNPGGALMQYATWNATQKAAATDDAMIDFIRGQSENSDVLFRERLHALGDIVDSSPVYVRKPPFKYTEHNYATFISDNADRRGVVYAGANDGMLHAFDADDGAELWAYIPTAVIPNLYKLADEGYANNHEFFVDGPITIGDAWDGSEWKTLLVGGLGRGGKAFYMLDVTDPDDPKAVWEFGTAQDADMGYSYGNPILTKRSSDDKWVVLVTSGYNNTGGDSKGRLYVLDAFTGAKLEEIITDNSVTDPNLSGIAKINNYVYNTLVENVTQYVYGGDLKGALWRFNLSDNTSQRLGLTSATDGNQPITVRPEIGRMRDSSGTYYRAIFFGTGRYLGLSDISASAPSIAVAQGIYGVKDTGADLGVLTQSGAELVGQTLDNTTNPRSIPNPIAVDWSTKNGWFVTLDEGFLVNVDPRLQLGTLVTLVNEPNDDYCSVAGNSWLYALDYRSGIAVRTQSDHQVGFPVGNSIGTGLTLIRLVPNKLVAIVTQADTSVISMDVPVAPSATTDVRRVGWREIF